MGWPALTMRCASPPKPKPVSLSASCIAFAAKFFSGSIPPTLLPPRKPWNRDRHREGQGSRSFGLRVASLAKLYQSTGRPADAHAVLAPALEGFSPTPEMPEIAEAQALLVAIEAGAHERPE